MDSLLNDIPDCDKNLGLDEACLHINAKESVSIYSQVKECYECTLLPLVNVTNSTNVVLKTVYPTEFFITNHNLQNCSLTYHFSLHGVYGLNISSSNINSTFLNCSQIYTIKPGEDIYQPLWMILWSYLIFFIVTVCIIYVGHFKKLATFITTNPAFRELQNDLGEPRSSDTEQRVPSSLLSSELSPGVPPLISQAYRHRVKAIDTFRGITIALMLFVNSGGGQYSIFQHSPWNGLTLADIIFPWFVWIMGFSVVMSVKNQIRAERRRGYLFLLAKKRSLILMALGIMLNSFHNIDLSTLRLTGVLQRIAMTYFIVSSLQICFVTPEYIAVGNSCVDKLSDVLSLWVQWFVIFIFIGIHTYLSFNIPFENCPPGYLGPGGLSGYSEFYNCTGGIASYIDRITYTPKHMYKYPSPQSIYHTVVPVDPEGGLGILTCCFCAFLGVQAGQTLISFYNPNKRLSRWFLWATITGLIGGWLCDFSKEGGLIPVNKNLWSLSFCLVTSSLAFIMLIILYLLVDHWMIWNGAPFIQTGRNSILLYFGSYILGGVFPFCWKPIVTDSNHWEYLIMSLSATSLWIIIACLLSKRKIFITV